MSLSIFFSLYFSIKREIQKYKHIVNNDKHIEKNMDKIETSRIVLSLRSNLGKCAA